jgi:predicted nucleic acid-binding protein
MKLELIEMRTPRVYLETTMFNYYLEPEREAHADTVKLFEEIRAGKYQAFTSVYATRELLRAPDERAQKMINLISEFGITILEANEEADALAATYQEQGIIPQGSTVDAQHIAVASVNDLDMIVSLNFKHIVRKKTVTMTGLVNTNLGYKPVEIHSPMEVVDRENA